MGRCVLCVVGAQLLGPTNVCSLYVARAQLRGLRVRTQCAVCTQHPWRKSEGFWLLQYGATLLFIQKNSFSASTSSTFIVPSNVRLFVCFSSVIGPHGTLFSNVRCTADIRYVLVLWVSLYGHLSRNEPNSFLIEAPHSFSQSDHGPFMTMWVSVCARQCV